MKQLIIKLDTSSNPQPSNEGVKIQKISSSISPKNFIHLLRFADNKVNPRIATVNKITKAIHETLTISPDLFWLKSKGILVATENCNFLDRNRIRLSFDNQDFEGIMDGGHNTFAIAIFLIEKLFDKKIKKWEECKIFWQDNFDEILKLFEEKEDDFKFSIPIEIITPSSEIGAIDDFYDNISEICSARNNNVQLKDTAKGNQIGCYDFLKGVLNEFDIIWKTGEAGNIKSEDVISLATLCLLFLDEKGKLPKDSKTLNKISIYSQKGKCVDFFNDVISNKEVSKEQNGKVIIEDESVKTALNLTKDVLFFFDKLFIEFPQLYHKAAPGKFGRIASVDKRRVKVPFCTTASLSEYQYSYGFFYPLVAGLTQLMRLNEENIVSWKIDLQKLDLSQLDLLQYVELIKMVNYDPQKVGKGIAFYNEAEAVFSKLIQNTINEK